MLTHTSILHRDRRHLRAGQAMIEMMLGVILIMLLIAGMVQFVTIASTHSAIDAKIRGDAGVVAMSPLTAWDTPDYILTWKAGPDGQQFTADDQKTIGIPNTINLITSDSVRQGSPTDWNALAPLRNTSTLDLLHQSPTPLIDLGLIGIKLSQEVPVIDIIQELVYAKPTVTVEESVWFPVTKGLY